MNLVNGREPIRSPVLFWLILLFGLLLWRGIRVGDLSQQILSALKALAFGILIGLCLFLPVPAGTAAVPAPLSANLALVTAGKAELETIVAVTFTEKAAEAMAAESVAAAE